MAGPNTSSQPDIAPEPDWVLMVAQTDVSQFKGRSQKENEKNKQDMLDIARQLSTDKSMSPWTRKTYIDSILDITGEKPFQKMVEIKPQGRTGILTTSTLKPMESREANVVLQEPSYVQKTTQEAMQATTSPRYTEMYNNPRTIGGTTIAFSREGGRIRIQLNTGDNCRAGLEEARAIWEGLSRPKTDAKERLAAMYSEISAETDKRAPSSKTTPEKALLDGLKTLY